MVSKPTRLERITNLFLALLETPRPLSLREIGVAVAGYPTEPTALRQAFERDKRTLREEGVPIAVERIDGEEQVGYRILPEDYYLPDLDLTDEEQEALAFALAAVRLDGDLGRGALDKLAPDAAPDLPAAVVLPTLPDLAPLQEAVRTCKVAHFAYRDRPRAVEGHGLVFRLGAWYFVGRDRASGGELRTFRVDRIGSSVRFGEPGGYERPEHADPASALRFAPWAGEVPEDGGGVAAVVLDVDVRELTYARSVLGENTLIERSADGSGRFRVVVADEEAFVTWAVAQGDAIAVREPAHLRQRVVDSLEALAAEGAGS